MVTDTRQTERTIMGLLIMFLLFVIGWLSASPIMDWWYRRSFDQPRYERLSAQRLQEMRETAMAIVMNNRYPLELRERAFEHLNVLDEHERQRSRFNS